MARPAFCALLACALVLGSAAGTAWAGGKYYRWVDENGQVHFGERPQGAAAEELELRVPGRGEPGNITPASGRQSAGEQQDEPAGAAEEAPSAEELAEQKEKCQRARKDIAVYSTGRRLRVQGEGGTVEYLTEEKRAEWLDRLRKAEEKFCN